MHFRPWNGQYHRPKWCLLQYREIAYKYKLLMFSNLHNTLIFRVFASEDESARKFSLIFWGRTENSDRKIIGYWKSVSGPYCFHFDRRKRYRFGIETVVCLLRPIHTESVLSPRHRMRDVCRTAGNTVPDINEKVSEHPSGTIQIPDAVLTLYYNAAFAGGSGLMR